MTGVRKTFGQPVSTTGDYVFLILERRFEIVRHWLKLSSQSYAAYLAYNNRVQLGPVISECSSVNIVGRFEFDYSDGLVIV